MSWAEPVSLEGEHVELVPLTYDHEPNLREAVSDGELWRLWYTTIPTLDRLRDEITRRLTLQRNGAMVPFAVLSRATGRAIGMTTYLNIEAEHRRLEIGATWYRRSVQRTPVNTECKRLLLAHAFERLNCVAVEFRTSFNNAQSRRAIERLGAKLDGVLRSHRVFQDGSLRDTCVYSIIAHEWPTVRTHLDWQLTKPR